MKRRFTSLVLALALVGSGTFVASNIAQADTPPAPQLTSAGQEFWLAFDINEEGDSPYLKLFLSGSTGTKGTVGIEGLDFSSNFTLGDEGITSVDIPLTARGSVDYPGAVPSGPGMIAPLAIHVTADHDVTVYGLNRAVYTTDAYLGLPVAALGQRYRVVDYEPFSSDSGSFLSAVATQDNTTVSVTPDSRSSQQPFTVSLSKGQVFEWEAFDASLTGSIVTSDKPVSVFSGNRCAYVPSEYAACDHLVEQMMPTTTWGKTFVTYPLYGRTADTFRIVADVDGTQVTVNQESGTETHALSAGEYWEFMSGEPMAISSNQPIEVAQYSNGEDFDNTISDPFMVLVPPYEQGFTDSTFATPTDGFTNYVNITAPTASIADVKLDGQVIPADQWEAIPNSVYSGVSVTIDPGNHSIASVTPIQTIVYGFGDWDSYGYPGGLRTARIAEANVLTLGSPVTGITGNELCVNAVLVDADGNGIPGARVDITITGAVAQGFSVVTGADGSVPVCATSTQNGTAAVAAVQGDLSANSSLTWAQTVSEAPAAVVEKEITKSESTGGWARLATGDDPYTLVATLTSDGVPVLGLAGHLTAVVPANVTASRFTDIGGGKYSVQVSASVPGNYLVTVLLDGVEVIGSPIPVNFIGATIEEQVRMEGDIQSAEGLGFLPGEDVYVVVHSDPINIGRRTANTQGRVPVTFTVPKGFDLGRHTVDFVGVTSGTAPVSFSVATPTAGSSQIKPETGGTVVTAHTNASLLVLAGVLVVAGVLVQRLRLRTAKRG